MIRSITYLRFSPRPNAAECESLSTQGDRIAEYTQAHGYRPVLTCFDRAVSGGGTGKELDPEDELTGRAGLWLAIDTLQPGDRLIVYKRDRLARSVYAMEWIRRAVAKRGAQIESLQGMNGDTDEEVLVQHILAAASEYERRMVKARTRDGMARLRAESRYCGAHAPYGYRVEKRGKHKYITPEPSERAILEEMKSLAGTGLGMRRIAKALNFAGHRCRGKLWEATSIRRILKREGGK